MTLGGPAPAGRTASEVRLLEATEIAAAVGALRAAGPGVEAADGTRRPLRYDDVAILVPTRAPLGPIERALDDAEAARRLFEALLDQARRLDGRIIEEVAHIASRTDWPLALIFRDLGRERRYSAPVGTLGQHLAAKGLMDDFSVDGGFALMHADPDSRAFDPPLKPAPNPTPLDITVTVAIAAVATFALWHARSLAAARAR